MKRVVRITKKLADEMKQMKIDGKKFDGIGFFNPQEDAVSPHWFVTIVERDNCSKKLYPEIQKELSSAKIVDHNPIIYNLETMERIN